MDLKLVNIWYKYPPKKIALKNISLNLTSKVIIIVGPNASGKTTLLKLVSLIYRPWKGKILVDNKDYWSLGKKEQLSIRRKIVYVHEKPLYVRGTIMDNILLGFKIRGIDTSADLTIRALDLLKMFKIESALNAKPSSLSTGQLQLISIIRALMLEPELLVLDEPTANLDGERRKTLLEYLGEYVKNNKKIIIATHDLLVPLLLEKAYIIVLDNGEIISKGYVNEVLDYEYKKLYNVLKKTNIQT